MRSSFNNVSLIFNVLSNLLATSPNSNESFKDNYNEPLFLTKYIESGNIEVARNLSLVSHPIIPIESYSGYFTVNKEYNSNLFFWFFPAKEDPDDSPVVLWLAGGPGDPFLDSLFFGNGPLEFTSEDKLTPREYSWHLNHNLIYIDNPVGTGFSFTKSDKGYARNQIDVSKDLLNALKQFFLLFPHLQKNEFFASGESYAGKYVPALGYAIHEDNKRQIDESDDEKVSKINLKGLMIASGFTDPLYQSNYSGYLYNLGLIDSNGRRAMEVYESQGIECIKKRDFKCAFDVFDELLYDDYSLFKNLTGLGSYFNYVLDKSDSTPRVIEQSNWLKDFLQDLNTSRAIHVGVALPLDYENNEADTYLELDFMDSVAHWVAELLSHYPILIFNGQLDIIDAYPLTVNYLNHLNFTGADEYKNAPRHIWRVENEVAGYVKHAGNLTEALVRNAGHMVAFDQPKWAFDLISRFTHHKGFE